MDNDDSLWPFFISLLCIVQLAVYGEAKHLGHKPAYIEDNCEKSIKIKHSKTIGLSEDIFYKSGWLCETTLEVREQHQIRIEFLTFNVGHSTVMYCTDVLRVFDGDDSKAPELSPTRGLCGRFLPSPIQSNGNKMTLKFKSRVLTTSTGFQLVATEVRRDVSNVCKASEFKCGDEYCIDKSLLCDGYPHCFDSSDESKQLAGCQGLFATWTDLSTTGKTGIIIGVVSIGFVLVWLFVSVSSCLYTKRYYKRLRD